MEDNESIVLTLSNGKKYVVVESINYENNEYLFLGNIDNPKDLIICKRDNDKLKMVTDEMLKFNIFRKIGEKNNSALDNVTE